MARTRKIKVDENGYPRWTAWDVIKGRTILYFLTVYFLVKWALKLLDGMARGLEALLPEPILLPVGLTLYAVGLLLCFPLAVMVQSLWCRFRQRKMSPEEAVSACRWVTTFRWSCYLGTVIGTCALAVTGALLDLGYPSPPLPTIALFSAFIIGTKILNRVMVKVTHTNEELIQGMEDGTLWDELPEEMQTEKDIKAILKKLKKGAAFTLERAVYLRDLERGAGTAVKWGVLLGAVFGAILSLIFNGKYMDKITQEICEEIQGTPMSEEEKKKKAMEEARDVAAAEYYAARDWARKGAAVNPNSSYTRDRVNEMKYWESQM